MLNDLLHFNTMLTPKIITFIYWLLLLFAAVSGLSTMFGGYGFSIGNFAMGLGIIAIGALAARVWCEIMILLFKIHENTQKLAEKD